MVAWGSAGRRGPSRSSVPPSATTDAEIFPCGQETSPSSQHEAAAGVPSLGALRTRGPSWGRGGDRSGKGGKAPASHLKPHAEDGGVRGAQAHPDNAPGGILLPEAFSCSRTMKRPRWRHRQLCPPPETAPPRPGECSGLR